MLLWYCSLVVILIISSTCLMSLIFSLSCFVLTMYSSLFTDSDTYLSLGFKVGVYLFPTHASCPLSACSLITALWAYDTFAQNKLPLFWFLIRLDCGLWLFPRSEQLVSILSDKFLSSLLIKTETSSIKLQCPVQTNLQIPQYPRSKNNNDILFLYLNSPENLLFSNAHTARHQTKTLRLVRISELHSQISFPSYETLSHKPLRHSISWSVYLLIFLRVEARKKVCPFFEWTFFIMQDKMY